MTVGAGYEVLGSDGGNVGFKTPIATAHKFNGFVDQFLSTPDAGLQDLYFFGSAKLPAKIKLQVAYHIYDADEGSTDYGDEINVLLGKKVNDNWSFKAKFVDYYMGSSTSGKGDKTKYTVQTDYNF